MVRPKRPAADRRRQLQRAVGLLSIAGAGLVLGAGEGVSALEDLERLAVELGVPPPAGVRESADPRDALDAWAAEVGVWHGSGWCGGHRDGHWACHC